MKTSLLTRNKATVFALFLFLMNAELSAQTITRHYVINENHSIIPFVSIPGLEQLPLGNCAEVINPINTIGNNENDYSILKIDYEKRCLDQARQTLIFQNVNVDNNTNRVVIGIGSNNGTPLSADILKDLKLSTGAPLSYYGTAGNDIAYKSTNNVLLKLGGTDQTRGEIEIPCTNTNPCNHIRIEKGQPFISILDIINGYKPLHELRVYYAYQYMNYQNSPNTLSVYHQNGLFTLDKNIETEGSEITLTNTSGKEVYRSKLRTNTFESNQPGGVYIMTLQTKEGKTYSKKIIVK